MRITDALRGEHGLFYAMFGEINTAMLGPGYELPTVARTLTGLLASHARLEENHLFPALRSHIGDQGPLAVMEMEHRQIDQLLDNMATTDNPAMLQQYTQALIELCVGHFAKEEGILFHLAEQYLSDEDLTRLGDAWADVRGVSLQAAGCAA